ncbi:WecB/TagA/CpsF family glycosyltransferase [Patescibacteria group bacterium]
MISKEILGVRVDFGLTMKETLNLIELYLKDNESRYICTTNPEFIMEAQVDGRFKNIINKSDLSLPDGIGTLMARRYLEKVKDIKRGVLFPIRAFLSGTLMGLSYIFRKGKKEEKITGVDLTYKMCELAAKRGYTVFFLGGRPKNFVGKHKEMYQKEMSVLTAEKLQEMYPGLKVIGASSKFDREERDDKITLEYIHECMKEKNVDHIDFIFVAYNHNWQEKWIVRNSYKIPAKVSVGLGGTFDYIMGHNKLPPNIIVKINLGWLYRLIKQPWRAKRIFTAFPSFPLKVFKESIKKTS